MNDVEDEMPPEVPLAEDFLAAVIAEDNEALDQLQESEDIDWWNVSLTLALLIKRTFSGEPRSMSLVAAAFRDAEEFRQRRDD